MANPLPKPEKSYRILWILSPVIKVEPLRGRRDCSATQWSVVVGEGLLEGFKLVFGRGHDRGRCPLISIGDQVKLIYIPFYRPVTIPFQDTVA